ncbi:high mobility group protein B3-like [Conger conger]|uniref:high mobility group protein B3-like n=1 Tax=Conger conger TaxID=82655 RepID=UPI002A5AA634|nr:high mobility group protein B3-like [Conger conger]
MAKGDPHKPKGRMSAYAFFVQACHKEHKKKNSDIPINFAVFSKKCFGRWKTMSGKEKSRFDDMAKQDKALYDEEMMSYMPAGKKGKKKNDPNAPKRPPNLVKKSPPRKRRSLTEMAEGDPRKPKGRMSAYAFFVLFCHEEHKKNSDIPINYAVFSKKCLGRWQTMSGKEKSRFDDMAKQDKARYDEEMMSYMPAGKSLQ